MQVNMIWVTLVLLIILLITRVITLETFHMNLATITLIIILIMLLFSSLSIQYVNGAANGIANNSNRVAIVPQPSQSKMLPVPSMRGPATNLQFY